MPGKRPKIAPRVLIRCSEGLYLDGYDGKDWETTDNKRRAWPMSRERAEEYLPRIKEQYPNATIEVNHRE
jgi:hypothetical protein